MVDFDVLSTEFPDNRIVLVNGSELVCYPKVFRSDSCSEDNLSLDKSGEYLTIRSKPVKRRKTRDIDEQKDFFYRNAFLFYRNAHRILNDSRMFLAPVPVQNVLAYTGTSGLHYPTLGVYVEWWLNCDADVTKDKKGMEALTCRIAGSPLSGNNHCTCVYPDGEIGDVSHYPFINVWSSFMKINKRYTKAQQMYESYTLDEVVDILQAAGRCRESELETLLDIAEGKTNMFMRSYFHLKEQYNRLQSQYKALAILHYKQELEKFRVEYCIRKNKAEQEIESLASARAEFRSQMKQGNINNVEFQHAVTPLTKRKKEIEHELITFRAEKTVALVKKGHITYSQIDSYINQEDGK